MDTGKKYRNMMEEVSVLEVVQYDGMGKIRGNRGYFTCPQCHRKDAFSVVISENYCHCYHASCKFHANNSVQYFMKTRGINEFKDACKKMEQIF